MSDTREKILDTAEKMFADLGIDGASLRAITDAAGVNLGSIHYYFKTKDQLVVEVLVRRIDQFNREATAQLAAMKKYNLRPSVKEAWLVMIGAMLEFRSRYPDYLKFIQHLLVSQEQMIQEILLVKNDVLEENLLALLSVHFLPKKRKQAITRCQLMLEMLYQTVLNFNMVQFSLHRSGIHFTDAQVAEHLADMAVGSLSEFVDQG